MPRITALDAEGQGNIPGFRAKRMPLREWMPFKEKFEQFFMAGGADPQLALFIEWHRPDESPLILIPDYQSEIVERLSPGGWHPLPDAGERRWTMLVGNATAMGDFGLNITGG